MLWDSTGTSDLYDSAIVHPWRWLPINPLEEKMSLKCRHAKSRHTGFNLFLDVQFSPDGIQPSMLALECLPFNIILHMHVQLYPFLKLEMEFTMTLSVLC